MDFEKQFIWECLCRGGCGRCKNLIRKHGMPICISTGSILEEKPVKHRTSDGGYVESPPAPVPTDNCPFNPN